MGVALKVCVWERKKEGGGREEKGGRERETEGERWVVEKREIENGLELLLFVNA